MYEVHGRHGRFTIEARAMIEVKWYTAFWLLFFVNDGAP